MSKHKTIELRNGKTVTEALVPVVMVSLNAVFAQKPEALTEIASKIAFPPFPLSPETIEILQRYRLLELNGSIRNDIESIIDAAVKMDVKENTTTLVNPKKDAVDKAPEKPKQITYNEAERIPSFTTLDNPESIAGLKVYYNKIVSIGEFIRETMIDNGIPLQNENPFGKNSISKDYLSTNHSRIFYNGGIVLDYGTVSKRLPESFSTPLGYLAFNQEITYARPDKKKQDKINEFITEKLGLVRAPKVKEHEHHITYLVTRDLDGNKVPEANTLIVGDFGHDYETGKKIWAEVRPEKLKL